MEGERLLPAFLGPLAQLVSSGELITRRSQVQALQGPHIGYLSKFPYVCIIECLAEKRETL